MVLKWNFPSPREEYVEQLEGPDGAHFEAEMASVVSCLDLDYRLTELEANAFNSLPHPQVAAPATPSRVSMMGESKDVSVWRSWAVSSRCAACRVCQPTPAKALKEIAVHIGDRGHLSEKDLSMLEERIKTVGQRGPEAPAAEDSKPPGSSLPSHPSASMLRKAPGTPPMTTPRPSYGPPLEQEVTAVFHLDLDQLGTDLEPVTEPDLLQHELEDPEPKHCLYQVMCKITSVDLQTSIQALTQMDEVFRQSGRSEVLVSQVDRFLKATVHQLRLTHGTHMADQRVSHEDVSALYTCVMGTILTLLGVEVLAVKASAGVLKDLVNALLTVMLDPRVEQLGQGRQVINSINDALEPSVPPKFSEYVMKCLWRMNRFLPETIARVNLDQILLDIHNFMKAMSKERLKGLPTDMVQRTLKTLLHTLCRLTGPKILDHLTLVDRRESHLEAQLKKALKSSKLGQDQENGGPSIKGNTELCQILKKISSKASAQEGLSELWQYKQKHPDVDLEPQLKTLPPTWQSFIERGLRQITAERQAKTQPPATEASENGGSEVPRPSMYRDRLKALQQIYGLDNKDVPSSTGALGLSGSSDNLELKLAKPHQMCGLENKVKVESGVSSLSSDALKSKLSQLQSTVAPQGPAQPAIRSSSSLDDIRRRLERMKNNR
ncbi:hypothetical protein CRUP_020789 [Coryphaenoides rupestris]|nr:hypothetical protein CRUP_020789 [Coryphaenoides rupestris]